MKLLRYLSALYFIAVFCAAIYFANLQDGSFVMEFVFGGGITFYVMALGIFFISQHQEKRSVFLEMLMVGGYPWLAYLLFFDKATLFTPQFWIFIGLFSFIMMTGGFLLGMLSAPVLAYCQNYSWKEVSEMVKHGFEYMGQTGLANWGKALIFAVTLALVFYLGSLTASLKDLNSAQKIIFYILLFLQTGAMAWFFYKHSVFGRSKKK